MKFKRKGMEKPMDLDVYKRQVLCWWGEKSPHREKTAVICDGAVRSGKTMCLSLIHI